MTVSRRGFVLGASLLGGCSVAQASKLLVAPTKNAAASAPAAPAAPATAAAPQPFVPSAQPAPASEPFHVKMDEWRNLDFKYQRQKMAYASDQAPGTIVVDAGGCFLYYILGGGQAIRYGVSLGKAAHAWTGQVVIQKLAVWPVWVPAPYHLQQIPSLVKWIHGMPGGPDNPLGARAMYLYQGKVDTVNRIHGGAAIDMIGSKKTAGCIGMLNCDVIDLYNRVRLGTKVVMVAGKGIFG
ncbi:L,D-transpeptidase [Aestuariivirga litoralis]|uniref:L,D-transpeptidase n=1 Tax=Aestuariivirga litoralis TaxID=2650924 RepID=UPI0018C48D04|nr:L,D-transpeptidase [Aestuariivirga litoralis]MBG1231246.1 L,D-transpeptidase [Aestuariivirga litoralis]